MRRGGVKSDHIWRYIDDQREDLADLVDDIDETRWSTPSLCDGWTVRDCDRASGQRDDAPDGGRGRQIPAGDRQRNAGDAWLAQASARNDGA
ncbi:MAG: maleylpyruvate isomerase N-terminal domain-containing protein [Mycobacterium sp.]